MWKCFLSQFRWRDEEKRRQGTVLKDGYQAEDAVSETIDSLWFDVPIDPSQVAGVQVDGKLIMFEDYK